MSDVAEPTPRDLWPGRFGAQSGRRYLGRFSDQQERPTPPWREGVVLLAISGSAEDAVLAREIELRHPGLTLVQLYIANGALGAAAVDLPRRGEDGVTLYEPMVPVDDLLRDPGRVVPGVDWSQVRGALWTPGTAWDPLSWSRIGERFGYPHVPYAVAQRAEHKGSFAGVLVEAGLPHNDTVFCATPEEGLAELRARRARGDDGVAIKPVMGTGGVGLSIAELSDATDRRLGRWLLERFSLFEAYGYTDGVVIESLISPTGGGRPRELGLTTLYRDGECLAAVLTVKILNQYSKVMSHVLLPDMQERYLSTVLAINKTLREALGYLDGPDNMDIMLSDDPKFAAWNGCVPIDYSPGRTGSSFHVTEHGMGHNYPALAMWSEESLWGTGEFPPLKAAPRCVISGRMFPNTYGFRLTPVHESQEALDAYLSEIACALQSTAERHGGAIYIPEFASDVAGLIAPEGSEPTPSVNSLLVDTAHNALTTGGHPQMLVAAPTKEGTLALWREATMRLHYLILEREPARGRYTGEIVYAGPDGPHATPGHLFGYPGLNGHGRPGMPWGTHYTTPALPPGPRRP